MVGPPGAARRQGCFRRRAGILGDRRVGRGLTLISAIFGAEPLISNQALRPGLLAHRRPAGVRDFLDYAVPRMTAKYAHAVAMTKENPALFSP